MSKDQYLNSPYSSFLLEELEELFLTTETKTIKNCLNGFISKVSKWDISETIAIQVMYLVLEMYKAKSLAKTKPVNFTKTKATKDNIVALVKTIVMDAHEFLLFFALVFEVTQSEEYKKANAGNKAKKLKLVSTIINELS